MHLGVSRWLGNHQPRTQIFVRASSHHRCAKFAQLNITRDSAQRVHVVKQVVVHAALQHIAGQATTAVGVVGAAFSC